MPQRLQNIALQQRRTSPRPIPPLAVTARQALVSRSASSAPEQAAHSQLHACSHTSSRSGVQGSAMHEQVGNAGLMLHSANALSLLVQTQPRRAGTSNKLFLSQRAGVAKHKALNCLARTLCQGVSVYGPSSAESSAGQVLSGQSAGGCLAKWALLLTASLQS